MGTHPFPQTGAEPPPQFSAHFYCGQTAGCINMPLGVDVGLSPGDFVLDGDPVIPPQIFGPCLLWANGWTDQDATWQEGKPQPRRLCVRWGPNPSPPQLPPEKRAHPPHPILVHVYCGQMAGWMNTPLGTEVDLGPGHTTRRGPSSRERGTAGPLFSPHVYCCHGRPSRLLLSSCICLQKIIAL